MSAGKKEDAMQTARRIVTLDSMNGEFIIGTYYSRMNNVDSAVYFYKRAIRLFDCSICNNNIGHIYFVNNQLDSARRYFNITLAEDSTNPFPLFNLATLDALDRNFEKAANGFAKAIDNSTAFNEAFVTHLELYFNKTYTVKDSSLYYVFSRKTFMFEMQYIAFNSLLYCFMRDSVSLHTNQVFEYIFPKMFAFKDYDMFTWYHHACYKALLNDKTAALQSLEKALKLGFGTYFLLVADNDLAPIRNTKEFKALLLKYFPRESLNRKS